MAKLLRLRRGTSTQHTTFTGAEGEVTVNTTNDSLHVHDGTTAGGTELAKADLSNVDGSLSNNLGFADNVKAQFGTGNDLQIYHDGSHSYVKDAGTGSLYIQSDDIRFINSAGNENLTILTENGAATLYHDNSAKLATTSTGINVTGTVTCDGLTSDGDVTIQSAIGTLNIRDTDNTNSGANTQIAFEDSAGTDQGRIGYLSGSDDHLYLSNERSGGHLILRTQGSARAYVSSDGHFVPWTDDTYDLGTSTAQWRNGYFDGTVNCDGLSCDGSATIQSGTGVLILKDSDSTGNAVTNYIVGQDSAGAQKWYYGYGSSGNQDLYVSNSAGGQIQFQSSGTTRFTMQAAGHLVPETNNAQDLGTSTNRWRNVYTNDLNLSNEGGTNDVDGTWGSWTIQEGEDDLFLLNRRNGKKYKFNLSEVN